MMNLKNARALAIAAMLVVSVSGLAPVLAAGDDAYQKARNSFEAGKPSEAAKWLEIAVSQGHKAAQLPLAAMYRDGHGVDKNYERALALFTSAANDGYPSAQFSLGVMYRLGEGVKRDYVEALKWYRMAAKQGDAESQNSLGVMYESARGTKTDMAKAYMWYELAAHNGSQRGDNNRRRLTRNRSVADISGVKKLSLDCLASNYRSCD